MKVILSIIITLVCCVSLSAQSVKEYFSVGNPIEYCGTEFYLAWSVHPQDNYFVQEYLPEGESFDNYNQMFTVNVLFLDITPLDAIKAKIAELEERKQTDPLTNYVVAENDGEYILEFMVSDSNKGEINTVEADVHYYKPMTINGKKASVLFFYSCRGYGDDIMPFIQSIPDRRNAWYTGMSNFKSTPEFSKK